MKTSFHNAILRGTVLSLAFAVGIHVQGAPTQTNTATGKKKAMVASAGATTPSASANAVGLLDQAYGLLRSADHDYKGHRARAMHQIEAAAKEAKVDLSKWGLIDTEHSNAAAAKAADAV